MYDTVTGLVQGVFTYADDGYMYHTFDGFRSTRIDTVDQLKDFHPSWAVRREYNLFKLIL